MSGISTCYLYARVEQLADRLEASIADFHVRKIVKQAHNWREFIKELRSEMKWAVSESPVIWREAIEYGGTKLLIGGANDFQEYCMAYYGFESILTSHDMVELRNENQRATLIAEAEQKVLNDRLATVRAPYKVCLIGAANPASRFIIPSLLNGSVFGRNVKIALFLCDYTVDNDVLENVINETLDLAACQMYSVTAATESLGLSNADLVLLLNAPKRHDEDEAQWLSRNRLFYADYERRIYATARDMVKVLIVTKSNHYVSPPDQVCKLSTENFTLIQQDEPPPLDPPDLYITSLPEVRSIPFPGTFHSSVNTAVMGELQLVGKTGTSTFRNTGRVLTVVGTVTENAVRAVLAEKLNGNAANVTVVITWGVSSEAGGFVIDVNQAKVYGLEECAIMGPSKFSTDLIAAVNNSQWLRQPLTQAVHERLNKPQISGLVAGSDMSLGNSIVRTLHRWLRGGGEGGDRIYTVGVPSNGSYDVPVGLFFNFPVRFKKRGRYEIVGGLPVHWRVKNAIRNIVDNVMSLEVDHQIECPAEAPFEEQDLEQVDEDYEEEEEKEEEEEENEKQEPNKKTRKCVSSEKNLKDEEYLAEKNDTENEEDKNEANPDRDNQTQKSEALLEESTEKGIVEVEKW